MRVLVSAANGKLGAYVIHALARDHDLVLFARHQPGAEFAGLPWVQGDITSLEDWRRAVVGIDAIQHLAAQPWPTDHPQMRRQAAPKGLPPTRPSAPTCWASTNSCRRRWRRACARWSWPAATALVTAFASAPRPFRTSTCPSTKHATWPEDSYSFTQARRRGSAGQLQPGLRHPHLIYVARIAGIFPPNDSSSNASRRSSRPRVESVAVGWVGSEDVAAAHRLILAAG